MRRYRSAFIAAALVIAPLVAANAPATAATTSSYYASTPNGAVVKLVVTGSSVTSHSTVLSKPRHLFVPTTSLGSWIGGLDNQGEITWVWTFNPVTHAFHALTQSATSNDSARSPVLFNNGGNIAYVRLQFRGATTTATVVSRASAGGGSVRTLMSIPSSWAVNGLQITPDGKTLYLAVIDGAHHTSSVYRHSVGHSLNTSVAPQLATTNGQYVGLTLAPNTKTVAVLRQGGSAKSIVLRPVSSGGITKSISYNGAPYYATWNGAGSQVIFSDSRPSSPPRPLFVATAGTGKVGTITRSNGYVAPIRVT